MYIEGNQKPIVLFYETIGTKRDDSKKRVTLQLGNV